MTDTNAVRRVLLTVVPTGRPYGAKEPEKRSKIKIGGVSATLIENDSWEGGSLPDEDIRSQYHRCTWIEFSTPIWRHK